MRRGDTQVGDVTDIWAAVRRAYAEIGFAQKVDLAAGLAAEYRWLLGTP